VIRLAAVILAMTSIGLLTVFERAAVAQDSGTAQAPYLRLEWQFDSARGQYRNACGRVFNDRDTPARHVMIVFDGFDAEGKKVSTRFGEVVGDVPGRAYSIFCLMVKSGATNYRVSIPSVDWGPAGQ
jgi:hypothetical protein